MARPMLPGRLLETAGDRRPRRMIAARFFGNRIRLTAHPGLHKRSAMSDRPEDQKPETKEIPQETPPVRTGRRRGIFKPLFYTAIVVASVAVAYNLGIQVGSTGKNGSASPENPSFSRGPSDNLFSSSSLLKVIGQSPVDPSKVLFPSMERALDPQSEKKPKTCPPGQLTAPTTSGPAAVAVKKASGQQPLSETASPKPVDTPVIETKQPSGIATTEFQRIESPDPVSQAPQQTAPPSIESPNTQGRKHQEASLGSSTKPHDQEEKTKAEQFQLPGSMTVRIQNYSGTLPKWGLVVIVDDSASMGHKTRTWTGGRIKAVQAALGKLPETITPGSKVAVRDFTCKKSETEAKSKESACLSRMVLEWAEAPFSGLTERLDNLSPAGKTNPCAAALYSLKKDFTNQGDLTPRVLIITDAAGKCSAADVTRIGEQMVGKERVHVDVIALGSAKKKNSGYSTLAKKTNGIFQKVEGPGEMDQAMARYAKTLKSPIMEKVEIKGDKALFNVVPEEEIALTPGTYSVVLPAVAGINPGKRTIPSVKISSGEAVVIDVKVKKGRLSVSRSGKKSAE